MAAKHMSHSHCRVLHDVDTMTIEELEEVYDIEVDADDGSVWDSLEGKNFTDIHQWAEFIDRREREEDEFEGGVVKMSRQRVSDEY